MCSFYVSIRQTCWFDEGKTCQIVRTDKSSIWWFKRSLAYDMEIVGFRWWLWWIGWMTSKLHLYHFPVCFDEMFHSIFQYYTIFFGQCTTYQFVYGFRCIICASLGWLLTFVMVYWYILGVSIVPKVTPVWNYAVRLTPWVKQTKGRKHKPSASPATRHSKSSRKRR